MRPSSPYARLIAKIIATFAGTAMFTATALVITPAVATALTPLSAPAPPSAAVPAGTPSSSQTISGQVAVAPSDPTALAVFVQATATPSSPDYRHYLTSSAFAQRFGASPTTLAALTSYLQTEGLQATPLASHLGVRFVGSLARVQIAFSFTEQYYRLPDNTRALYPATPPSLPAPLSAQVIAVLGLAPQPLHNDLVVHPGQPSALPSSVPNTTPASIATPCADVLAVPSAYGSASYDATQSAALYHLDTEFAQGIQGTGVTVALVEFEPFAPSDIARFYHCYGLDNHLTTTSVDGGVPPGSGAGEAALDIELAAQSAPAASLQVYQGPSATDAQVLDLYQAIAAADTAQVVSTSWGVCEPYADPSLSAAEHQVFAQMAAQGQTVLAASGDSGSAGCSQADPSNQSLAVDDPASQPYITAVGGVTETSPSATPTVWNDCPAACPGFTGGGASGGGQSSTWPASTWQPVLSQTTTREVPDLSASADPAFGSSVYWSGGWKIFGGTSTAAPVVAGLVALADQGCAAPAGLITPRLYSHPDDFQDVLSGNNDLGAVNSGQYPALPGYDLATGLGVPNAATLVPDLQQGTLCTSPPPPPTTGPTVTALSAGGSQLAGDQSLLLSGTDLAAVTAVSFGDLAAPFVHLNATTLRVTAPPAPSPRLVDVTVTAPSGTSLTTSADLYYYDAGQVDQFVRGGWQTDAHGQVYTFGDAASFGSLAGHHLNAPVVGFAGTSDAAGYWLAASDGGVFAFGDAAFYGSTGALHLNKPVVGIAATPANEGYWLVAADGGIFAFGDAAFYGSTGSLRLNAPVMGMAPTPDGHGYWLVASDGGVFAFGDAAFYGSAGALHLNQPITAIAATQTGHGYWLAAADGGIFTYGDAPFLGSAVALPRTAPYVAIAPVLPDTGYWLAGSNGSICPIGAGFYIETTPWDLGIGRTNSMVSLTFVTSPYATGSL